MIQRRPSLRLTGPLAFAACMAFACPGQAAAQDARPQTLPMVPVVRLDAAPAAIDLVQLPEAPASVLPVAMPIGRLDDPSTNILDGAATVSLAISRPMPLDDLLQLLVDGTPLSLVLHEDASGTFKGTLRGLTMRQAIEAVLFPRSLDYDVQGNVVRVFPRRTVTRLFDINYLNVRPTWRGAPPASTPSTVISPQSSVFSRQSSVEDAGPLDDLARGVQSLLSGSGRVHVDRSAGLVQVTDFSDRLDQVSVYLEALEQRATRQVRLEARVFEIALRDASVSSIDWQAAAARAGSAVQFDTRASGLRVTDFAALMQALADQGTVRTIAAPRVVTMNNEPAVMRAGGQEIHFVAASQLDADGRADGRAIAPATILHGLTLTVTAQIAADGIVQLHVVPRYAERTGHAGAPVLNVTETDTTVRVRDGDTVIVAGLLQDRSELVILLTPTVVAAAGPGAAGRQ